MELDGAIDGSDDSEEAADLFRVVGRQVRLLRERAGLTQRELGERLGYSEELIRSLERGRRTPQPEFLDSADDLLSAGGLLRSTMEDVKRAKARARVKHPAWFKDYARLEADAVELCYYSNHTVPGLFQTEAHTRALYAMRKPLLDDELIEQRVTSRLARQTVLTKRPAPMVSCVIEEAILRRPIGEWDVHEEQLQELARLGGLRNVELQVMPLDRPEHAGLGGPFILLTPTRKPQVGYLEVQNISRLITDPEEVRILAARYGCIRSQALTPRESLALIERLLKDR
ncbi:helix-turn-helix domain-containing protein [Streptomyces sp. CB01580]|uniref:helix-turn-helix domain-containing protein n=1 Tax=Streptomyces sp. CB01580 TaxID=1703933 RepID=UPI00093FE774|nr:helix-turn-helix transcriptional regulator [Streptomyces sp. CB01580]OKJ32059.1 DNA-binding protein [Streptomyces sp. CB01580]